jgi:hypothetical protein
MMKMFLPLVLFLCASPAFARIGETLEECQARYGVMIGTDMTRSDYPAYVFRKEGIEVRVRLYNGKSAQEIFFGIGTEMKPAQIQQIESVNLSIPDAHARAETFSPLSDEHIKMLAALGVKVSQIDPDLRGNDLAKQIESTKPKTARAAVGSEQQPHPIGINGEDGSGDVLVVTTAEFDKVFAGTSGF